MLAIILLLCSVLAAPAWGATYYVDAATGSDSDNGTTEALAFATITRGITQINSSGAGTTIQVKNGTYTAAPGTITASGTSGSPIVIQNFSGHTPLIQYADQTITSNRFLIDPPGAPAASGYITIEGFEINNSYECLWIEGGHHITFRNNNCHDAYVLGIGGFAIDSTFSGNILKHIGRWAACAGNASLCNQDHGIYISGTRLKIFNNIINDNMAYGIQSVAEPFSAGTHLTLEYAQAHDWLIAFNTFVFDRYRGGLVVWDAVGGDSSTNESFRIENNIFYENCQLESGASNGIDWITSGPGHLVRNNLFYATAPGCTIKFAYSSGGDTSDFTESNTLTGNPLFVAAGSGDFTLSDTSPAIGTGRDLTADGITTDYLGLTRNNPPSMGAFESNPPDPPAPGGQNQPPLDSSPRMSPFWRR